MISQYIPAQKCIHIKGSKQYILNHDNKAFIVEGKGTNKDLGSNVILSDGVYTLTRGRYRVTMSGGGGGHKGNNKYYSSKPAFDGKRGELLTTIISVSETTDYIAKIGKGGLKGNDDGSDVAAESGLAGCDTHFGNLVATGGDGANNSNDWRRDDNAQGESNFKTNKNNDGSNVGEDGYIRIEVL